MVILNVFVYGGCFAPVYCNLHLSVVVLHLIVVMLHFCGYSTLIYCHLCLSVAVLRLIEAILDVFCGCYEFLGGCGGVSFNMSYLCLIVVIFILVLWLFCASLWSFCI